MFNLRLPIFVFAIEDQDPEVSESLELSAHVRRVTPLRVNWESKFQKAKESVMAVMPSTTVS